MESLTKRLLVAALVIPLVLFLTFWDQTFPFRLLTFGVILLGLWEYLTLCERHELTPLKTEGMVALAVMLSPWVLRPWVTWDGRGAFLLALMLLCLSFMGSTRPLKEMVNSVSVTFFGAAYFGVLAGYLFRLRELDHGAWHLLCLFIATWAYDTGGFFAGSLMGKHPLAPLASPKKSWEGAAGGVLLAFLGLGLLKVVFSFCEGFYSWSDVAALAVLLSLFGQLGDLVESMMKRSLTAKDSGSFFPGHGGVFDRVDSLLFNAPALFYYLLIVKHAVQ
jgi:phosphatidate cytidylyltransferase